VIISDPKKAATMIVGRIKADGSDASESKEDEGSELEALAADFLRAVESKSASGVADAFKAMAMACGAGSYEEGEG
jgi:hypothetical protein